MAATKPLVFHYAPQSRALTVHWLLEELGQPYEMRVINFKKNEQKSPDYLAVNPMGKVPAISHNGVVVTEAAAICAYLADEFPDAGLAIPVGDRRRGPYLKWLFFGPSCIEPAVVDRLFNRPEVRPSSIGYGSFDVTLDTIANALRPDSYLLGDRFTAADIVIGGGLFWAMSTKAVPARPEFKAYTERVTSRPAWQRVAQKNAEMAEKLSA
jgi:glutathione S-transferase